MAQFFIYTGLMTILLLVIIAIPLLSKRSKKSKETLPQINLEIYRDQFKELENELSRGAISQKEYDEGREELERRVLEDSQQTETTEYKNGKAGIYTTFTLIFLVPLLASTMWIITQPLGDFRMDGGKFEGVADYNTGQMVKNADEMHDMDEALNKLKHHLEAEPGDLQGWMMYGRSLLTLRKYNEAAQAFEQALQLAPGNPIIMVDLADAVAMTQNQDMRGLPWELIKKALQIDPKNWKALMMAGTDYFNQGDYKMAVMYWERLRKSLPATDNLIPAVDASIKEARTLGNIVGPVKDTLSFGTEQPQSKQSVPMMSKMMKGGASPIGNVQENDAQNQASSPKVEHKITHVISGIVELSPQLASKALEHDTLYITARPASGSRAPIVQLQLKVLDFPVHFKLDNTMFPPMDMGGGKLSDHEKVIITARLGKAGSIMPQPGDLEGSTKEPVSIEAKDVKLELTSVR